MTVSVALRILITGAPVNLFRSYHPTWEGQ
uniref:Uncharacterized protein n=1 Tax=Anguilla anguilla TaxID=7936 RepID=A0A0E9W139_ANGAN